jgi:hypothetical protein
LRLQPGTVFVPRLQIYVLDRQHSRNPTSCPTKANLCLIQDPLWESFTVITNITVRISELGQKHRSFNVAMVTEQNQNL